MWEILYIIRAAYREDPVGTVLLLLLAFFSGFAYGFRILGPTLG